MFNELQMEYTATGANCKPACHQSVVADAIPSLKDFCGSACLLLEARN
jgi:hypothetical protein